MGSPYATTVIASTPATAMKATTAAAVRASTSATATVTAVLSERPTWCDGKSYGNSKSDERSRETKSTHNLSFPSTTVAPIAKPAVRQGAKPVGFSSLPSQPAQARNPPQLRMHTGCQSWLDVDDFINPVFSTILRRISLGRKLLRSCIGPIPPGVVVFGQREFSESFPFSTCSILSGNFCALSRVQYR